MQIPVHCIHVVKYFLSQNFKLKESFRLEIIGHYVIVNLDLGSNVRWMTILDVKGFNFFLFSWVKLQ